MIISGAIVRNPGYNDGDQSVEYAFNNNLKNLIASFMDENLNKEVELELHFVNSELKYLDSRKFTGIIEYNSDYSNTGLFLPDLFLNITSIMCVKPIKNQDTLTIFSNFTKEDCERFEAEYVEVEM